jgi:hypothetical protein
MELSESKNYRANLSLSPDYSLLLGTGPVLLVSMFSTSSLSSGNAFYISPLIGDDDGTHQSCYLVAFSQPQSFFDEKKAFPRSQTIDRKSNNHHHVSTTKSRASSQIIKSKCDSSQSTPDAR